MVESPCTKLCQLDPRTGWCLGCGRTGEEIGAWLAMGDAQRSALVATLPERMRLLRRAG
jgi:predicted Fe-S protein YdhL (DUF1289 family)